jgi:hypothetical protein
MQHLGIAEDEYTEPQVFHEIPERAQLALIMCSLGTDLSAKEILSRRIHVVDLLTSLCAKREVQRRMPRRATVLCSPVSEEAIKSVLLVLRKTQCPICIGEESLTYAQRNFEYCRPAKMWDHVEKGHLKAQPPDSPFACHHSV